MIYIYWVISIVTFSYLLIKKRKFDLFTIGIITFVYYNSPAFIGYINLGGDIIEMKIDDKVYYFLVFIQVVFLASIIIYDNFIKQKNIEKDSYIPKYWIYSIFIITIAFFALELLISGIDTFLSVDKSEVNNSRFYNLAIWGALLSLYLSIQYKYKHIQLFSFLIILFTLFVGSRAYFATAVLGIILLFLGKYNMRLITKWRYLLAGAISFFFLVFYKTLYKIVKTLDFDLLVESLKSTSLEDLTFFGEANAILANLNVTILTDFTQTNQSGFLYIIQQIPLLNSLLEEEYTRYSYFISNYLHPNIGYGMGSSLWAEFYSVFGYFGMFVGSFIWIMIIFVANYYYQTNNRFILFILPAMVYSTFYIHRLDLSFVLSPFKTSILVSTISFLFYFVYFRRFVKSKRKIPGKRLNNIPI